MADLETCLRAGWQPGLGDPGVMGWVTVAVYALAAFLAARLAARAPFPAATRRRERAFWIVVALVLAALAINKQLDLQSLLTVAAKCLAKAQGWYEGRRALQRVFILAILVAGVCGMALLAAILCGTLRRTGAALLGLGFVTGFVLIRAAGFHHMDNLIHAWIGGVRVNWALELPGPLLVAASALWLGWRGPPASAPQARAAAVGPARSDPPSPQVGPRRAPRNLPDGR